MHQSKAISISTYSVYVLFAFLILYALWHPSAPASQSCDRPIADITAANPDQDVSVRDKELDNAFHVFETRSAQLVAIASDIRKLLYGMIVIVGISIYATIARPKRFKLPLLDLDADATWLRWCCPPILTGLWLYFGYELYAYILGRIYLTDLGQVIENSISGAIARSQSLKYSIEDQSIGDFLFYLFSPMYDCSRADSRLNHALSWAMLLVLYGGLLGVTHGAIMAGVVSWVSVAKNRIAGMLYLLLIALLIAFSHLAFSARMPKLWKLDLSICVFGAVTFYFLPKQSKDPESTRA